VGVDAEAGKRDETANAVERGKRTLGGVAVLKVSRHVRSLVAVSVLLLAAAAPAQAFHRTDPPLASGTLSGSGSISYHLDMPTEGPVELEVQGSSTDAGSWAMAAFIRVGGGWGGGSLTATGGSHELHVEAPAVGTVIDERGPGGGGFVGVALGFGTIPAGEYSVVLGGATDGDFDGEVSVWAPEDAAVTARTDGTGFIHREADFHDGVSVIAGEAAGRVKAIAVSSLTETVEGTLFAWFGEHFTDPIAVLGYEGPGQSDIGQQNYFLFGVPGGTYTFTVAINAGAGPLTGLWVWGFGVEPA
jgi:hypothetical protein